MTSPGNDKHYKKSLAVDVALGILSGVSGVYPQQRELVFVASAGERKGLQPLSTSAVSRARAG